MFAFTNSSPSYMLVFVLAITIIGEMRGTIHQKALDMYTPDELSVGAVIVLRQVSVFAPSPRTCHLNVTRDNIVQLFSPISGVVSWPVRKTMHACANM